MNEANAYTIRPATAADSTMIKRTVRQARLDRTGLDWRNFKIAELVKNGDMIGFVGDDRYDPHDRIHGLSRPIVCETR